MEVWFPDGNGGRKLVNMAGTAAADTEEQTGETPALRTAALSRAAPLLASAGEDAEDDEAREIYYPDRDGGRVLLSSGSGITSLPTASQTVKGAVMIGTGLAMNGDTLNVSLASSDLPIASTFARGAVRIGNGLAMNGDVLNVTAQNITLPVASDTTAGVVKVGNGLAMVGDTLNVTVQSSDDGGGGGCCCGNVYFAGSFSEFPTGAPRGWLVFVNNKAYIYNGVTWLPFCNCGGDDTPSGGDDTPSGGDDTPSGGDDTPSGGIPLVTAEGNGLKLYSLAGQSVKQVGAVTAGENGIANVYSVTNTDGNIASLLAGTIAADDWTTYTFAINDANGSICVYDSGTCYKNDYYEQQPQADDEFTQHFFSDRMVIASNIDSNGNRFDMVIKREKAYNEGYKQNVINETAIEILRNNEVVQTVGLQQFATDVETANPQLPKRWELEWYVDPYQLVQDDPDWLAYYEDVEDFIANLPNAYTCETQYGVSPFGANRNPDGGAEIAQSNYNAPYFAFIENAQKWAFWCYASCTRGVHFLEDPGVTGDIAGTSIISPIFKRVLARWFLVTASGSVPFATCELTKQDSVYPNNDYTEYTVARTNVPSLSVPLQDGFYYEVGNFFDPYDIVEIEPAGASVSLRTYGTATFYTPTGEAIYTGIILTPQVFPICEVEDGFLLHIESGAYDVMFINFGLETYNGVPVTHSGLHLIKNGQIVTTIPEGAEILNQRLRSMTNEQQWAEKIKSLVVPQNEIR